MNPEDSPKVKEIREKLSSSSNNESTENEIYSYLVNFFSRYYKDGDFVSLRRYKKILTLFLMRVKKLNFIGQILTNTI